MGRVLRVGEWTDALSAPAAEIKRTDRFLLSPHRNTTKRLRYSSVPLLPPGPGNSLSVFLSLVLLLFRYRPANRIGRSPAKLHRHRAPRPDRRVALSRCTLARSRQNRIAAFSVSYPARRGGLLACISRPVRPATSVLYFCPARLARRGLSSFSSHDKYLPRLLDAVTV